MTIFYDIALKRIDDAIATIDRITDNTKFAELELQLHSDIVGAVHQIADYYARTDHLLLSEEDKLYFRAFAYLNNQIKHDQSLEIIYFEVCESEYSMRYPFIYGEPEICWNSFVDNGRKNAEGKREHYDARLVEREIKQTLCDIREIIVRTAADGENTQTASAAVK